MTDYLFRPVVENWQVFAQGVVVTIEVSVASLILSLLFGLVLAILRVVGWKPALAFSKAYVEIFRNIPPLLLLFYCYFAMPRVGIVLSAFTCGVLAMTVYHAGFMAEILRAGIESVGRHQVEAARALGLTYLQSMRHVILPQALATILPPLGNTSISLTKTTSLVAVISVPDVMFRAQLLETSTFRTFEVFAAAGAVYLFLVLIIGQGTQLLERRITVYRGRPA